MSNVIPNMTPPINFPIFNAQSQKFFAHPIVGGKTILSNSRNPFAVNFERLIRISISPNNFQPVTYPFTQNIVPQFRVNKDISQTIRHVMLEGKFSNTSTTATVTPCISYTIYSYIDLDINGSGTNGIQIVPFESYINSSNYYSNSTNSIWQFGDLLQESSTYGNSGNAIAVSSSKYFKIPIISPVFSCGLNPSTLNADLLVNVHLNGNAVSSGTGTLVLESLTLSLFVDSLPQENAMALLKDVSNNPQLLSYTNMEVVLFQSQNLTPGVNNDLFLPMIRGPLHSLGFAISASGATNTNDGLTTWSSLGSDSQDQLGSADLLSGTKQSLLGSGAMSGNQIRSSLSSIEGDGTLSVHQPFYLFMFSRNPLKCLWDGSSDSGVLWSNGTFYLRLNPNTLSGNFDIRVFPVYFKSMTQVKGYLTKN